MKTALIIPAYKPAKELLGLLEQFAGNPEFLPVVVDDGIRPLWASSSCVRATSAWTTGTQHPASWSSTAAFL